MDAFNLERLGDEVTRLIKRATWFPYKTGKLKFEATSGSMWTENSYRIHFSSSIAPYVVFLEEGTDPHDIPNAFGFANPGRKIRLKNGQIKFIPIPGFGIGGRFNGKFHPGSTKHKGFIKDKSVNTIVEYITSVYGGIVEVL
jgi:hypothetical protein